jgi:hypothetical protein
MNSYLLQCFSQLWIPQNHHQLGRLLITVTGEIHGSHNMEKHTGKVDGGSQRGVEDGRRVAITNN